MLIIVGPGTPLLSPRARKRKSGMKEGPLPEAGKQEIVTTRHCKPSGVLIGFASEDGRFEYRLGSFDGSKLRVLASAPGDVPTARMSGSK